jgi:hypothetical protein
MANLLDLYADVGANIIGDDSVATFRVENTSTGDGLDVRSAGATAVALNVSVSGASGAVLKLNNINKGFVSTNSVGTIAYAFKIAIAGAANGDYWVPVYTGKA